MDRNVLHRHVRVRLRHRSETGLAGRKDLRPCRTQSVAAALSSGSPALMFEDMDMLVLIQLVVSVLKENLGPFLQGLVAEA